MFLMRVKYQQLGGHTHVTFFIGVGDRMVEERFSNLGNSGTLILRNEEWKLFKDILTQPAARHLPLYQIELVNQDGEEPEPPLGDIPF